MEKVYEIFIKTTPERLWDALVDPEIRAKYNFGAAVTSDWTVGSPISVDVAKHGVHLGEGEVLEVDPPRRLVHTMAAVWDDEVRAEGSTRVTWEIEPVGDSCHLTVTHDQLRDGASAQIYGGWPMVLSGLKTWLETGSCSPRRARSCTPRRSAASAPPPAVAQVPRESTWGPPPPATLTPRHPGRGAGSRSKADRASVARPKPAPSRQTPDQPWVA